MTDTHTHSIPLPARQTVDFMERAIGSRTHLLDVGCGSGQVAAELGKRGKRVTGIDTNADKVAEARKLGVDAHVSAWPGFDTESVEAVLFAASLHHMSDVEDSLRAAGRLLKSGGVIVADEFAYEAMDAHTAEWLADRVCEGVASGFVRSGADPPLDALLAGKDPLRAWMDDHHGHVTPSTRMTAAAESLFQRVEVNGCPYLYRYLVAASVDSGDAAQWLEGLFRQETEAIEADTIEAIGHRMLMSEPLADEA